MGNKLIYFTAVVWLLVLGVMFSPAAWSQTTGLSNIVSWDATTDARVQATEVLKCVGSTMQCAAQGANWTLGQQVPMPLTQWEDTAVFEGNTYNYQACFWNQDQGCGGLSNVASKRVPFVAAPADVPNLGVN